MMGFSEKDLVATEVNHPKRTTLAFEEDELVMLDSHHRYSSMCPTICQSDRMTHVRLLFLDVAVRVAEAVLPLPNQLGRRLVRGRALQREEPLQQILNQLLHVVGAAVVATFFFGKVTFLVA
jgi:hypothetical protein